MNKLPELTHWKTKDGRKIPIKAMMTGHIQNCINMLKIKWHPGICEGEECAECFDLEFCRPYRAFKEEIRIREHRKLHEDVMRDKDIALTGCKVCGGAHMLLSGLCYHCAKVETRVGSSRDLDNSIFSQEAARNLVGACWSKFVDRFLKIIDPTYSSTDDKVYMNAVYYLNRNFNLYLWVSNNDKREWVLINNIKEAKFPIKGFSEAGWEFVENVSGAPSTSALLGESNSPVSEYNILVPPTSWADWEKSDKNTCLDCGCQIVRAQNPRICDDCKDRRLYKANERECVHCGKLTKNVVFCTKNCYDATSPHYEGTIPDVVVESEKIWFDHVNTFLCFQDNSSVIYFLSSNFKLYYYHNNSQWKPWAVSCDAFIQTLSSEDFYKASDLLIRQITGQSTCDLELRVQKDIYYDSGEHINSIRLKEKYLRGQEASRDFVETTVKVDDGIFAGGKSPKECYCGGPKDHVPYGIFCRKPN